MVRVRVGVLVTVRVGVFVMVGVEEVVGVRVDVKEGTIVKVADWVYVGGKSGGRPAKKVSVASGVSDWIAMVGGKGVENLSAEAPTIITTSKTTHSSPMISH